MKVDETEKGAFTFNKTRKSELCILSPEARINADGLLIKMKVSEMERGF